MSYDLDRKLIKLGPGAHLTTRMILESVLVLGRIGGGKTTASGKVLAQALLRAGFGLMFCIAKHDEIDRVLDYTKKSGRYGDVVIFDETKGYNFIEHDLVRQGMRGLPNVVECLIRVIEMANQATGATGRDSDSFWLEFMRQILTHTVHVLYSAYGTVSVTSILDFVTTAAVQGELYTNQEWVEAHYAGQTLRRCVDTPAVPMSPDTQRAMLEYFIRQYPAIPEKTRGNGVITLTTKLDRFKHGRMKRCFNDKTDIVPEMLFGGAIIILAMPALTWNDDGKIGQQLVKYMAQRTIETRASLPASQRERPVAIFADEAQYFANSYDDTFISTSRGSRAAMIYLSQTLPAFYAKFGRDQTDAVDGLIGKFGTQIFHSNACSRTNKYASELIGRDIRMRANHSRSKGTNRSQGMNAGANTGSGSSSGTSHSSNASFGHNSGSSDSSGNSWGDNVGMGESSSESSGASEQMDFLVEPAIFAGDSLRSGGPANDNRVDAVLFRAGARFRQSGGRNYMFVTFKQ
jgi:TraM recognition site of TraD and TraG